MSAAVRVEVFHKRDLEQAGATRWNDPYGIATLDPQRRRLLLGNPLLEAADAPVALVGLEGDTVIGKLDMLAGEVAVHGTRLPALWTSVLYVHPDHRQSLLGVALILKMQQLTPLAMACGVSQAALPVYHQLRWADLELDRTVLLIRSGSVVRRYLGGGSVANLARRGGDVALAGYAVALRRAIDAFTDGLSARQTLGLAPEHDARLAAGGSRASCHRSSAWIEWLLANSPEADRRSASELHVVEHRSGAVAGYVLIKTRFHATASSHGLEDLTLGSVADWQVLRPELVDERALVLIGVRRLLERPIDAIEVCTADSRVSRAIRKLGGVHAGALHVLFKAAAGTPLADPTFRSRARWQLRPVEGDNFFF